MTTTADFDGTDRELEHVRGIEALRTLALQRLGDLDAVCGSCDETEPLLLQLADDGAVCCYRCADLVAGRCATERHHLAGRLNIDDTIVVDANDHRMLSAAQSLWPTETLRNPNQSPLLTIAAVIRGWIDILRHLIFRSIGWIPDTLEALNDHLTENLGPTWWQFNTPDVTS